LSPFPTQKRKKRLFVKIGKAPQPPQTLLDVAVLAGTPSNPHVLNATAAIAVAAAVQLEVAYVMIVEPEQTYQTIAGAMHAHGNHLRFIFKTLDWL